MENCEKKGAEGKARELAKGQVGRVLMGRHQSRVHPVKKSVAVDHSSPLPKFEDVTQVVTKALGSKPLPPLLRTLRCPSCQTGKWVVCSKVRDGPRNDWGLTERSNSEETTH